MNLLVPIDVDPRFHRRTVSKQADPRLLDQLGDANQHKLNRKLVQ